MEKFQRTNLQDAETRKAPILWQLQSQLNFTDSNLHFNSIEKADSKVVNTGFRIRYAYSKVVNTGLRIRIHYLVHTGSGSSISKKDGVLLMRKKIQKLKKGTFFEFHRYFLKIKVLF